MGPKMEELAHATLPDEPADKGADVRVNLGTADGSFDVDRNHEPLGENARQGQYLARPEVILLEGDLESPIENACK